MRDSGKFLQGEKESQRPRGGAVSRQRLKFTLKGTISGRMGCVGYSLGTNMFEAYPWVLIKKGTSKQGKHYGKIIDRNSPVKTDKNYKERYELGMRQIITICCLVPVILSLHKSKDLSKFEVRWQSFDVYLMLTVLL